MYKLLIVEDDPGIAQAIQDCAAAWEMDARTVRNFRDVVGEFTAYQPHIVLLDIILPFFNGYYWCEQLRRRTKAPILFLSSASDNMNIVMAMSMGADDFIAKPFDQSVLMAKVQALLRRAYDFSIGAPVLEHRDAILDTGAQSLSYGAKTLSLTKNEYRILLCLMEHKGKVVSREKLMERLWETDSFVDENTLTVNINRLRKKLDGLGLENFITTKFGVGYWIGEEA